MVLFWGSATECRRREAETQQSKHVCPALTTPKMPIPEPMVVIVGMMSNFPAWWQGPEENRVNRKDPARKGQALPPQL